MLIQYAFDVQAFQVSGGPEWTSDDMFEISAIPPDSSELRHAHPRFINEPPSEEERRMLQSLLFERFGLKIHHGTKQGQVYLLSRGNKTLQLQPAKHADFLPILAIGGYGYGGMSGQTVSMSYMAMRLSRYLESPVLDRTGLVGTFDFKLEPHSGDSSQESKSSFLDGIFESVARLGLKLNRTKAPIDTIIIDEVSKPTEN